MELLNVTKTYNFINYIENPELLNMVEDEDVHNIIVSANNEYFSLIFTLLKCIKKSDKKNQYVKYIIPEEYNFIGTYLTIAMDVISKECSLFSEVYRYIPDYLAVDFCKYIYDISIIESENYDKANNILNQDEIHYFVLGSALISEYFNLLSSMPVEQKEYFNYSKISKVIQSISAEHMFEVQNTYYLVSCINISEEIGVKIWDLNMVKIYIELQKLIEFELLRIYTSN